MVTTGNEGKKQKQKVQVVDGNRRITNGSGDTGGTEGGSN